MIYIGLLGIISLILVVFLHLTGVMGALGLGTTLLAVDLFWQGLRLKLFATNKYAKEMMVVLLFLARVLSILVLIIFGHSCLTPRYFSILTAVVLTIPVWTVLWLMG